MNRLSGNRLFLYTQKIGAPVFVPMPPLVVEALESCPLVSERCWFWTGVGSKGNTKRYIEITSKRRDATAERLRDWR